MYTELITIIMGISLVLYLILGGADFGAGILEIFIGDKANDTVTKAMAPVWEANHMWLIIAIVILFNGFPLAYKVLSTNLHIPVLIFLLAIVFRGAAFTFRHYDAYTDGSQKVYSFLFRYSSLVAVFALGVVISAFYGGTIPVESNADFLATYVNPWFNFFSLANGLFMISLTGYIASVFLLGEVTTESGYQTIKRFCNILLITSIISGIGIFLASYADDLAFHSNFLESKLSIVFGLLVTLLIPLLYKLISKKSIWTLRLVAGIQITMIMLGWFIIQWPNLVIYNDGSALSIYTANGPEATMKILFWALAVGVVVIFPGLYVLFKIFKTDLS